MQQKQTVASALLIGLVLAFGPGAAARAEPPMQPPPPGDKADLAKQAQNPIASLISLPLQNNFNFGVGPEEELQYILNVQPVVPLKLNDDWNLITRTVVPLIYQPTLAAGVGDKFGLSDVQLSLFLSPTKAGAFTWGVGPVLQFPTATDEVLGTERWAAGPTGVALLIKGPWVVGALVNQLVRRRQRPRGRQPAAPAAVPQLQPSAGLVPDVPAGGHGELGSRGRQHLDGAGGGGVGKIFRIGMQPMNGQLAGYYNVERPDDAAEWQVRFQLQFLFLFPK